ncbi:hypothetical protein SAMN05421882_10973 [Nitrosomonas communis]|uniref:Uncharacterized protein n=1 Tax=Nitrosomonas communis TaxID=44574 RepID=A0A1H2ZYB1_9PROT|nr:hypothetical protein SAMN05421882_10973 [Nitrosomonas communis]
MYVSSGKNLSKVLRAQRRAKAKPLPNYASFSGRNEGIIAAYQTGDYIMKQIENGMNSDYITLLSVELLKKQKKIEYCIDRLGAFICCQH